MILTAGFMAVITFARILSRGRLSSKFYKAMMAWSLFLFLGELVIYTGIIRTILLAPPTAVLWKAQYYLEKGYLQINIISTMGRFIQGFAIAIILGIPLGVIFGLFNRLYDWIAPALNFVRMTPPPAILPFAIILFGIGDRPGIFVITLGCFFPILLDTIRGVRDTETIHCETIQTMGGTQWDVLRYAIIPSAIPSMITGIRIGFGIGWLVLISSEIVAADSGLGFMIQGGRMRLDTPVVFLGMATICVLGLSIDFFLKMIEKFFTLKRKGGGDYVYG